MKFFKWLCIHLACFFCFVSLQSPAETTLNRPYFKHKNIIPPLPTQSKNYINIVNYNICTSNKDQQTTNAWSSRNRFFFKTVRSEAESQQLMQQMQKDVQLSLSEHLPTTRNSQIYKRDPDCVTCRFSHQEPFPIGQTEYFRIALKVGFDH